ncbi:discoidin domain-containing protein [Verrucomicrobiaceae bacterium N1E253]|uniref:Discoidin domain-containing protein n=1 Tax=Oceaniferula marina TaxID=2748318 RepID=A0A851GIX9_9BACT|nr:discoidin domain-containing protein [Oceaniferula marina]NWK57296.1 discoidin domain-containing protein [Oceaniferula marina]
MRIPQTLLVSAFTVSTLSVALADGVMVSPEIDNPSKPWCYFGKPTSVIGVPFMPDAIQVTYDGSIYTKSAEYSIVYGDQSKPVMQREKSFLNGWIPIIRYSWKEDSLTYEAEAFTAIPSNETQRHNTTQWMQIKVTNTGSAKQPSRIGVGIRSKADKYRLGPAVPVSNATFKIENNTIYRNGKVLAVHASGCQFDAVDGTPYSAPFQGITHHMTPATLSCIAWKQKVLQPGQSETHTLSFPRVPVAETASTVISEKEYNAARSQAITWWETTVGTNSRITLPEKRLEHAHRAGVVHSMLGTRERKGKKFQSDGIPYPNLFLIAATEYQDVYDSFGLTDIYRPNFKEYARLQLENGLFLDTNLSHGKILLSSHGQVLSAISRHILVTRDKEFGEKIFPMIEKAMDMIITSTQKEPNGLLPPSTPYDAEMIKGYYTSHNLLGLLGVRSAIRVATMLEKEAKANEWRSFHTSYEKNVTKAIQASAWKDGYIPTGLYSFITGPESRKGFAEYRTDQDWDNNLLAWPTEVLDADDPRVVATCDNIRKLRYREGIQTYRNGQHLHQYITTNQVCQYLVANEQKKALEDIYHILLHSGSNGASFENLIQPWGNRTPSGGCPPPHAWGTIRTSQIIRSLLYMPIGGRAGIDPEDRDLLLFSATSPSWNHPGNRVAIANGITEFGNINASMTLNGTGADYTFDNHFHANATPRSLRIPIPWFVQLLSHQSDAEKIRIHDGVIYLSPDATELSLTWKEKPKVHDTTFQDLLTRYRMEIPYIWKTTRNNAPQNPEGFLTEEERQTKPQPLSFATVKSAYQHEYQRRYQQYLKGGGKPWPIEAPSTKPTPKALPQKNNSELPLFSLTTGKKVTASSNTLKNHPPSNAVDGKATRSSYWAADGGPRNDPAWVQIDLGKTEAVTRVHIRPYYGNSRIYKYYVEHSPDGKHWDKFIDHTKKAAPTTLEGNDYRFQPTDMRYIRVTVTHCSINTGRALLEISAYK